MVCAMVWVAGGTSARSTAQDLPPKSSVADAPASTSQLPPPRPLGGATWQIGPDLPADPDWSPVLYPPGQRIGWFADLALGILKPHLKSRLTTPDGFTPAINLPVAPLDWTAAPEFVLGYRLGEAAGEVRLSYRLVGSSGDETRPAFDAAGAGLLRSRLNVNTIDLDYVAPEVLTEGADIACAFLRDLRVGFGLRVATAFFDSHAAGQVVTDETVRSMFAGVGPRVFTELHKDVGVWGLAVYTRMAASGVFGPVRQRFGRTVDGEPASAFFDTGHRSTGTGIGAIDAGLSWCPEWTQGRSRLTLAYTWERWWNLGRTDDSNAELTLQGIVLRVEIQY
jgi:hypothetical protein